MYIHNVRYGFATNSSSSHSIILMNEGETAVDNLDYQGFGWDFFTAASEEAKRQYMGQTLMHALVDVHRLTTEDAAHLASKWVGVDLDPEGYIDHQSLIALPCESQYGNLRILREYFDDLLKFILQPNIVIGGGNDNTDEDHPIIAGGRGKNLLGDRWSDEDTGNEGLRLLREYPCETLRARYDERGKFWVLFDTSSGKKVRCSFDPDANAEKSEAPELVDVKITDQCDRQCRYCYQGSTPEGEHADGVYVGELASALGKLGTFEVAIGGGEPTQNPQLVRIIDQFSREGVKPSLSTRNEDWVVENWPSIRDKVGGIGLSIDGTHLLVDKLSKLRALEGLKLTVHVVVGSCSAGEIEDILEVCRVFGVTVLLLGWKSTHRGEKGPTHTDINLKDILDKFKGETREWPGGGKYVPWNGPRIAFDTVLVQEMKDWLEENANRWSFSTREGAHSMYIDCVEQKMARSSYENEEGQKLEIDRYASREAAENIKRYFATL